MAVERPAPSKIPQRSEVAEEHTWDLSKLYVDDQAWEVDLEELEASQEEQHENERKGKSQQQDDVGRPRKELPQHNSRRAEIARVEEVVSACLALFGERAGGEERDEEEHREKRTRHR